MITAQFVYGNPPRECYRHWLRRRAPHSQFALFARLNCEIGQWDSRKTINSQEAKPAGCGRKPQSTIRKLTKKEMKKPTSAKPKKKGKKIRPKLAHAGFAISDPFGKPYIAGDTRRYYIYSTKTAANKARKGKENIISVWIVRE